MSEAEKTPEFTTPEQERAIKGVNVPGAYDMPIEEVNPVNSRCYVSSGRRPKADTSMRAKRKMDITRSKMRPTRKGPNVAPTATL